MTDRAAPPDPVTEFVDLPSGVRLHTRRWPGEKRAFILLHGLSSNCATWERVAQRLAAAGHAVVAVDQRGHGLSDKPDGGYDFATVSADLAALIRQLQLDRPVVAGQSWGGNVVLEFAARCPGMAHGLVFVEGGFLDLQSRSQNGADEGWAETAKRLRPPDMDGARKANLEARIRAAHPEWSEWGVDATLRNFEWLPDGTVRRWLPVDKHMRILRALWEQRPPELYPRIAEPTLICPADDGNLEWLAVKRGQVAAAEQGLARARVHWFCNTPHDIHVARPRALADLMLAFQETGPSLTLET